MKFYKFIGRFDGERYVIEPVGAGDVIIRRHSRQYGVYCRLEYDGRIFVLSLKIPSLDGDGRAMYVIMGQQDMACDEKELRKSAFAGSVSLYGS